MDDNARKDARAVLDAIRRVVRVLRLSSRAAEKHAGVSGAQLFVLQTLEDAGTLSINELASRTLTDQSSVSVVVQRLVERGLVERVSAKHDARRVELSLTPAARELARRWPGAAQESLIHAVEQMPNEPRTELARLLQRLVSDMGIAGEKPVLFFEDDKSTQTDKRKNRRKKYR